MTFYNPHLLPRQELIETFVARQPLLDELLDGLRRGGAQHHLLVGDRGTGKTTLLLRLATAIEDDQKLAKKCIPLRFPEEQYNVSRPSDFWMNAIDALVDALERQDDHAAAKRLEARLSELETLDEPERAKQALAALEGWAKQARRAVVLLIDNLDLVLARLAESLWELREALSIENRLVLIGASSKFVHEAIDYESAFYEFFHVHELGPLSEDEARRIVLSHAQRAGSPRVAEVLEHDPGRFKALYVLTGGTPRTLALLHTVLALGHHDRVERDLDGLLDQLTPYYKARFDDLPAQSQVIVDAVALHWHPITAAECQAATRLDLNAVSAQLSRLVKSGVLAKVSLPEPGKLGFQLAERFFNIWYLMRASRRLRRRLAWFVEFLRIFYGEEDLRRRAEELVQAAPRDSLSSPARFLAFAAAIPDEALRRRLEFRAIGLLVSEGIAVLRDAMDLEGEDRHLVPVVDRVQALRELRAQIAAASVRLPPGHTPSSLAEQIAQDPVIPLEIKQAMAHEVATGNTKQVVRILKAMQDFSIGLGDPLRSAVANGEVPSLADVETVTDLNRIFELAETRSAATRELLLATEGDGRQLPDELLRRMVVIAPSATEQIIWIATLVVGQRDWARIRHLMLLVMRHASTSIALLDVVVFLRQCISSQLTAEALALLVDAGVAERWAPLYEALRAVAEGGKGGLDGLAPEMRAIALALYKMLCDTDRSHAEDDMNHHASTPRPRTRRPTKRRTAPSSTPVQGTPQGLPPAKRARTRASGSSR